MEMVWAKKLDPWREDSRALQYHFSFSFLFPLFLFFSLAPVNQLWYMPQIAQYQGDFDKQCRLCPCIRVCYGRQTLILSGLAQTFADKSCPFQNVFSRSGKILSLWFRDRIPHCVAPRIKPVVSKVLIYSKSAKEKSSRGRLWRCPQPGLAALSVILMSRLRIRPE